MSAGGGGGGGEVESCAAGGRQTCDANAVCTDYATGFCCNCTSPYIGNGYECVRPGRPTSCAGSYAQVTLNRVPCTGTLSHHLQSRIRHILRGRLQHLFNEIYGSLIINSSIFATRSDSVAKAVVPCQTKIILKNFRLFQCFNLTWNHV